MPIKPGKTENEQEFISRCMSEETQTYPNDQAYAICKSKWDRQEMSKIKDTSAKVMARVAYDTKFRGINLQEDGGPCWDNYIQIGTKIVDGREVPDCRGPIEEK
jgi:hypothetical protein